MAVSGPSGPGKTDLIFQMLLRGRFYSSYKKISFYIFTINLNLVPLFLNTKLLLSLYNYLALKMLLIYGIVLSSLMIPVKKFLMKKILLK